MDRTLKAGELVVVTTGHYSDYSISGVWRVLKDFSAKEQIEAFLVENPGLRECEGYKHEPDKLMAWFLRRHLLDPIECLEWQLDGERADGSEAMFWPLEGSEEWIRRAKS